MASRSANSDYPDHNPSTKPASQPVQAAVNEDQATVDASKESSPKSVFVNSQPIREEQVQNAVKFLSDPRVRGSLLVHRRHFLEGKGLTKEEIDEAFQRVPDLSLAVVSGQNSTYQDAQSAPVTNIQTQAQEQLMQPVTASPSVVMPTTARRFQWSYAVLAAGFLTIVGAGTAILFKNAIIPGFKSWIRRVVLDEEDDLKMKTIQKPNLAEEVAVAAKAAAAAATDVAKASQEMLITKIEEKRCFMDFRILLNEQLQEIRMLRNAITRLEGQSYSDGRHFVRKEYLSDHVARSMQISGLSEFDTRSVRSFSPAVSSHSKSNMKITAMAQRGEIPPYIRDIDDLVTNNKPISNPILAPRTKPRDAGQITRYSSFVPQSQVTSEGATYMVQSNAVTSLSNDSSAPWWQRAYARIAETNNGNVPKTGSASNGMGSIDNQTQRRWVPPQPPPVSLPEAAAAIRQPKSIPKNVDLRSENTTKPVSELDELPRITNISGSGGQLEMNGASASSQVNPSEIQEEQVV